MFEFIVIEFYQSYDKQHWKTLCKSILLGKIHVGQPKRYIDSHWNLFCSFLWLTIKIEHRKGKIELRFPDRSAHCSKLLFILRIFRFIKCSYELWNFLKIQKIRVDLTSNQFNLMSRKNWLDSQSFSYKSNSIRFEFRFDSLNDKLKYCYILRILSDFVWNSMIISRRKSIDFMKKNHNIRRMQNFYFVRWSKYALWYPFLGIVYIDTYCCYQRVLI